MMFTLRGWVIIMLFLTESSVRHAHTEQEYAVFKAMQYWRTGATFVATLFTIF